MSFKLNSIPGSWKTMIYLLLTMFDFTSIAIKIVLTPWWIQLTQIFVNKIETQNWNLELERWNWMYLKQKKLFLSRGERSCNFSRMHDFQRRKAVDRSQVSIKVARFFLSETGVKRTEAGLSSVESPLNRSEGNTYNPPKRNPSRDSF